MTDQLDLDAIEAKAAELRQKIDRKNPWPSDNESFWTTEGWKDGTRNALDKLHPAALVDEVRRLRAELADQVRYAAALEADLCTCEPLCENGEYLHAADCPVVDIQMQAYGGPDAEESHVVADDSDDPEQCGAAHHQHPETVCTEPSGHYRRDVDPHAGPLIVDGRECGGVAWDEPAPAARSAAV